MTLGHALLLCFMKEERRLGFSPGGIKGGWGGAEGWLEGKGLGFSPGKLREDGEGKMAVSRGRGLVSLRDS